MSAPLSFVLLTTPVIAPPPSEPVLFFVAQDLLTTGLTVLLQSTLLLTLGLLAGYWLDLRGAAAVVRAAVYRATLAVVGLATLFSLLGTVRADSALVRVALPAVYYRLPRPAPLPPSRAASLPPEAAPYIIALEPVQWVYIALAAAWGIGTCVLMASLWAGHHRLRRRAEAGEPLAESSPVTNLLRQLCAAKGVFVPRVVVLPDGTGNGGGGSDAPLIAGMFSPTLFLPRAAAMLEASSVPALRAMLAHETAHLARRDCAWSAMGRVLNAMLWTQPLLPLLRRRLEQAAEEACDQDALAAVPASDALALADCLVRLAENRRITTAASAAPPSVGLRLPAAVPAAVAIIAAPKTPRPFRSSLGRRVQRILVTPVASPILSGRIRAALLVGAGVSLILVVRFVSATAATPWATEDELVRNPSVAPPPARRLIISQTISLNEEMVPVSRIGTAISS